MTAGFIYVVEAKTGEVKVGFSASPEARISTLRQSSPTPLRPIAIWPGTRRQELDIHAALSASWKQYEWYNRTLQVDDFLASLDGKKMPVTDWESIGFRSKAEKRAAHNEALRAAKARKKERVP